MTNRPFSRGLIKIIHVPPHLNTCVSDNVKKFNNLLYHLIMYNTQTHINKSSLYFSITSFAIVYRCLKLSLRYYQIGSLKKQPWSDNLITEQ